jgi:predicted Zn finger-like uncharacterized protein
MIVTCPNCQTRYNLPDAKVPAGGAKVKCSKCAHVFKTSSPPASPEEEVESLLEKEAPASGTQAGDDFDAAFDEVASGGAAKPAARPTPPAPEPEGPADEPADDSADDSDMDDLFSDDDTPDAEDSLFDDEEDGADADEPAADGGADDLFADDDSDDDGLFEDEEDVKKDEEAEDRDDEEEEDDEEEDEDDEDTGPSLGLGLDDVPEKKGRRSVGCLVIILVLVLGLGAAVYFKAWTLLGLDLGSYFQNVPYVGKLFMEDTGGDQEAAPGESPADRVRKIELKNVKQYYVANEKTGNLFVVEGKAVNTFATPKERIKVEVVLYDAAGAVLTTQAFLCGNVLSQFQLQVQTQKEIEDGLSSEVGILSNNTFIRPGSSTPFMAVFFEPPSNVKEFLVKVVDVGDPQ